MPQLALEERSLWIRLDLSAIGVSTKREATDALLRAAAARARGELVALDVRGCSHERVTFDALLAVVTANGASLCELRMDDADRVTKLPYQTVQYVLHVAPRLAVFEATVWCYDVAIAREMLRNEAPYGPLHVRKLEFRWAADPEEDAATLLALIADAASHAPMRRLRLDSAPLTTAALMDALVDAALTRQLTSIELVDCLGEFSEWAPALARLIGGGALADLRISSFFLVGDPPALLTLGNALRASRTLTSMTLPTGRRCSAL